MLCASEQRGVGRGRGSHSQLPPVRRHYGEQGSEGGGVSQPRLSHSDSWRSRSQPSVSKGKGELKEGLDSKAGRKWAASLGETEISGASYASDKQQTLKLLSASQRW